MNLIIVARKIREHGLKGSAVRVKLKLFPRRSAVLMQHLENFKDLKGLEVGGPTSMFGRRGLFPIYSIANVVDNVNFSSSDISLRPFWSLTTHAVSQNSVNNPATQTGDYFYQKNKQPGTQYFSEAADLSVIPSDSYDFLISSHMIEHSANPIKVLYEWARVVRPGGCLLLVAPNKELTLDHRRATTSLAHMIEDFEVDQSEEDLTHLEDSIENTDFTNQTNGLDKATFKSFALKNFETRYIHHHTFTLASFRELLEYAGFDLVEIFSEAPHHLIALAIPKSP